jgi:hypothetical protein
VDATLKTPMLLGRMPSTAFDVFTSATRRASYGKETIKRPDGSFETLILAITKPRSFEIYKERNLRCVF